MELGGHFFGQSSFAEHALVHEDSLVILGSHVPDASLPALASLACGVQAGAGAVLNVLRPVPTDVVVIAGAGGVGLAAVMATKLLRPSRVIVVDRVPERLALAKTMGADITVDTSGEDLVQVLSELTHGVGVDVAIDTTGHVQVIEGLVASLAIRGQCGIVGVPPAGQHAAFDVMPLVMGRSIRGIAAGDSEPQTFLPYLVDRVLDGSLPVQTMQQHYAFEDINIAAADAAAGRTVKPVLVFDSV
ncbi:zinc-binding dehydrogenase [Nocardioides sp. 1609]|uniref:zinc-binding dehydrogenase n=1 Tax=Nocardioides sp. 1609 TaxID=2508327 RepID=UPI0032AEBD72